MTNILYIIDENYSSFSKNEKKLSRFILNSPHALLRMSNQEVAEELNISVSTLNRFSQKLMNASFQVLRDELKTLFPKQVTPYNIELVNNEPVETLKKKLSARAEEALKKSARFTDDSTIDKICEKFNQSETVFIFGYGASYVCATDLYQKLSRVGLNIQLIQETHLFTTMLSTHSDKDCVVFITNNGEQSELQAMAKVVSDYHIPIIAITSSDNNPVARQSDLVLTYGHSDENDLRMGATTSLFAQMFTIDVLFYRYVALNYQSSLDYITQSKMALDNYRKHLSNIEFKH
ncbi:MurR/RpiR family transcriptional regulator [Staphylococcus petrasii]|uniref:MurR/RpiR family transcriptional regulator n=1 Tax=Staphylococcus petrasii TaxID=1276936 RepID=UPI000CD1A6CC|nr:MurR/RpiR family transcriptional regulator [Staphylococcus petrasii]MCI2774743.1 MurR/RpiR family transcriptional regulator [Staphylococcus petrasii]PNZ84354.1 MurR/RpiR family transcriptional regulator [Staphylococcus petrasii]TGA81828.1 MurR/RpiR family transcriptional regulator [Staphylococcus petrasii]SUM59332.1 RpiR family phosphosugar-binding transcriptional regulator [Staphylococcus petrasii]